MYGEKFNIVAQILNQILKLIRHLAILKQLCEWLALF